MTLQGGGPGVTNHQRTCSTRTFRNVTQCDNSKVTFMGIRIRESICPKGAHYRKFTAVADAINLGPGFLFIAEIK